MRANIGIQIGQFIEAQARRAELREANELHALCSNRLTIVFAL